MASNNLLIDPALFVWNKEDYKARAQDYWKLASDLATLICLIEISPSHLIFPPDLAEIVINEFPAGDLCDSQELRDVVGLVYSFLSRLIDNNPLAGSAGPTILEPEFHARAHFNAALSTITKACALDALSTSQVSYLATHCTAWEFNSTSVKSPSFQDSLLQVCLESSEYHQIREYSFKVYEPHDKHHTTYGYGSRLPAGASGELIQNALNIAIELSNSDVLCARIETIDTTLIFRRHERNRFHAYPIPPSEYSKYGINPATIPCIPQA